MKPHRFLHLERPENGGNPRIARNDTPPPCEGFTLIEILVVLTIVAALMIMVTPVLFKSKDEGDRSATSADIQKIKTALSHYLNDPKFGDLPPTTLSAAGFNPVNDINPGIEVLVAVLGAEGSILNPFSDEEKLINTDGDRDPKRMTYQKVRDFFEYADSWGNPLIYFRLRDFSDNPDATMRYRIGNGDTIEISPIRSKKTGSFAGAVDLFQIISLGPDEEYGTDDDVVSWKSS